MSENYKEYCMKFSNEELKKKYGRISNQEFVG